MLIAMPVWDTEENGRSELTAKTLEVLMESIRGTDRVVVSDNGSCKLTHYVYQTVMERYENFSVIFNGENLGIAGGTNQAWRLADEGEVLCKMDNDCVINTPGWTSRVEFVLERMPSVGILGMKRKDLPERPTSSEPFYRTRLLMVDQKPGEPWIVIEETNHVMGTCYCFNPSMLPEFGYLLQPDTVYGFDDAIAALRAHKLGYSSCFLHGVDIDHIDPNPLAEYTAWKSRQASQGMPNYNRYKLALQNGQIPPYFDGGFNKHVETDIVEPTEA